MILQFNLQPERYAVARLGAGDPVPDWAMRGAWFSVTRTADELSILCAEANVPHDAIAARGWRCLALRGPFAFTEIGIAAAFTAVLAKAGVSVLVVSTYDTDYLFVPSDQLDRAIDALVAAGHRVTR